MTYEQIGYLLDTYPDLIILAFPSNDFHQEPGTNEEIAATVENLLGKERFPNNPNFVLFSKSSLQVNPIYQQLSQHIQGSVVKHNFYKYLVDRDGLAVKFYDKKTQILQFESDIAKLLQSTETDVS